MTRRQSIVAGIVAAALAVVAVGLWAVQRGSERRRQSLQWTTPNQPPETVSAGPPSAAESLAANGCPPMAACCTGRGAGRRLRRTYPASLAAEPSSIISARVGLDVGGC